MKIVMVGLGGCTGSICRYLVAVLAQKINPAPFVPYGTLTVNIVGCLIIGLLGGLSETRQIFTPETRAFVMIGFLGGFTTFSTFGYETFTLTRTMQLLPALTYLGAHLILGFGAVWLGFSLSKII